MLAKKYLEKCSELLRQIQTTQLQEIEEAAELIAQAVEEGHTLFAWGGPHSSLPVQDIFWRAGGLALVNPLFTHGLSLEVGPIYLTTFLERVDGAGSEFFGQVGAEPGDVIILISTSGRNSFPIEMAASAKEAGLKVIGVTSTAYSNSVSSRHHSGKRMLLMAALLDMKLKGYGYAIIGGVGPAEFYRKAVAAEDIRDSAPGIWKTWVETRNAERIPGLSEHTTT